MGRLVDIAPTREARKGSRIGSCDEEEDEYTEDAAGRREAVGGMEAATADDGRAAGTRFVQAA
jgi:hypothetical protein